MRVRGLKQFQTLFSKRQIIVAPHAGAWIETIVSFNSLPLANVAPHAGAWIETFNALINDCGIFVAPHAGAWIETHIPDRNVGTTQSHPMRVRGLKQ